MIPVELFLLILVVPALIGVLLSAVPSKHNVSSASLVLCLVSCIVGMTTFFVIDSGESYEFPISSMLGTYKVAFDEFSSLMISSSSVVFAMIVIHAIRHGGYSNKYAGMVGILFIFCTLAMCADSIVLLLVSWEMMTLITFLMAYGREEVERWRYFTITHFGGLIIMTVFAAMWYLSGTQIFSEMDPICSLASVGTSAAMIILLFIGFGTKLGLMPFHAWMPDLYNTAPIHTVALLSTVCSNVAIVLLFKSSFLWIGIPDDSLAPLIIVVLAAGTAIWGAMESLIQTEPRRILAYSSMENMALVILCLSIGMIIKGLDIGNDLFLMIMIAAILHTINHSFFKSLTLLNVGTVEKSTGEHMIEKMGGLAKVLPALSVLAFIGVLSMAAIPPMNGFISEWLMIKTVITAGVGDSMINVVLPLIITVLGICGMLAAVSYARLYGFMFLGRPRSEAVANPKKVDVVTLIPLGVLAGACIALGVLAIPVIDTIGDGLSNALQIPNTTSDIISDSLNPFVIGLIIVALCVVVYAAFRLFRKEKKSVSTWDCGTELEPNMQYSSIGFTQPLVRVFHPIYGDTSEIVDDDKGTDTYRVRFVEPFIKYILRPLGAGVKAVSEIVGKIQTGNIQSYLAYVLVTLIVVLLGVRFLC